VIYGRGYAATLILRLERGGFSGRGVMTSDAGSNGRFPTFRWAVHLEPMDCAILAR
jgi:hypothetical protein